MKKGIVSFSASLVFIIFLISQLTFILAQDENQNTENRISCLQCGDNCVSYESITGSECSKPTKMIRCGAENNQCVILSSEEIKEDIQIRDQGITPDSAFYAFDKFLDNFGDTIEVKEEKVAEIKAMVEAGDIESAKIALEEYKKEAEKLKKEINPDQTEDAKISKAAIDYALVEISEDLKKVQEEGLAEDVLQNEENIVTASEIAGKIKDLCKTLSEIDPSQYYEICRTGDDSPKWQKKLDKELTEEQEKEAKKFGEIMNRCFESSGQECKCSEIPYSSFANACSKASVLASACEIEKDTTACDKLHELEMPELPPHLQDVFDELQGEMQISKFEMNMPKECIEAGVKTPDECRKTMIVLNAPEECREALLNAKSLSEKEEREICDKIMMKKHSPECAEAGISDPQKCRDYMYSSGSKPAECQEQGIENAEDCKMRLEQRGPQIEFNCKSISDSTARLECYDGATSQTQSFRGQGPQEGNCMNEADWNAKKAECRALYGEKAGDEPIMGDSGFGYQCPIDAKCIDFSQYKDENYIESECKDGCHQECPGASRTDCVDNGRRCQCYYEDEQRVEVERYEPNQQQEYVEPMQPQDQTQYNPPSSEPGYGGDMTAGDAGTTSGGDSSSGSSDSGSSGGDSGGSSDSGSSGGESSGGDSSSTTGQVILTGNAFLDYYFS